MHTCDKTFEAATRVPSQQLSVKLLGGHWVCSDVVAVKRCPSGPDAE